MRIGLTLPNRGVLMGVTTPREMLEMAEVADRSELFSGVWVGDSMLGAPRMESIALLSAIAARTRRVRLGPACMASFTLRDPVWLAHQWANLDLIAEGRSVLIACTGIAAHADATKEDALFGLTARDRVARLTEWIAILRRLWTEDNVSFAGSQYRFDDLTLEPKPAARPRPPIWIASNAAGSREAIERTHRRVARHADGWHTGMTDPAQLAWRLADIRAKVAEEGRDPAAFPATLYYNINVQEKRADALDEAKRFFETYYMRPFPPEELDSRAATGSPTECVERLHVYRDLGFDEIMLRVIGWDQRGQLERVMAEVLPRLLG